MQRREEFGQVPMLPNADRAKEETRSAADDRGDGRRQSQFESGDHDNSAEKSRSGVDVEAKHSGNLREQYVAHRASASPGDGAQQNCYEWMHAVEESLP